MKKHLIIITGAKHSGKSLCAKALGKITGWELSDTDELVEKQTGKSPRELFREGPDVFRKAETYAIESLCRTRRKAPFIVAAGGGIIDNREAMRLLLDGERAIFFYLEVDAATAWQRILRASPDGELPPFLNTENPKETHRLLHNKRSEAYKALAQITVFAENKTPEEIAAEINETLKAQFIQKSGLIP